WGVTYTRELVCALKGSSIDLPCSYNHPAGHTMVKSLWFIKQKADGEAADMREDEEYQGRVQYTQSSQNNCSLRITNLRETDAQTYRFRFHTDQSKYTGQPGVSLSVTDLEVKVSSWSKRLSCITTCALSNNPTYIWYKNGQSVTYKYGNYLYLYDGDDNAGSYSCAVKGHEDLRSPAVCVLDKNCWSVTYSSQEVCSLIGSSVDIHSYYTFPNNHNVRKSFWFIKQKTVDMTEDDEYQGRVQYTHSSQNNCSLGITNLRETDAQTYTFRFHTNLRDYTGEPGVSLSVTGLKITVSNLYSWSKKLNCVTSCTLSNNPIYIWYKNGQPVTNEYSNELDLYDNTDEDNYSCSIRGHEELRSPAVYSPKNTNAVVLSGETLEGGSVTLSCSSDANPPVETYSWFKREAPDTQLTTDKIYSISNLDSHHSGLYYCTAQNQLGRHDSTPVHLDVLYHPKTTAVVLSSGETVEGDSVTLSCSSDANPPVQTYSWFKKEALDTLLTTTQNYTISNINSQHSGLYYCTAHNLLGHHDSPPVHLDVLCR
ncbi:Schwann cell myelin protein-like, partial [Silurus meridionalis]